MNLVLEARDEILILRPVGRLDSNSSPELERAVISSLGSGCRRMLFDLAEMEYISSAGLRVVLLTGKKLRACEGKLVLVSMRATAREVFEMSGFLTLFATASTIDEALQALKG